MASDKEALEKQLKLTTTGFAVMKASVDQADEATFAEQYSKSTEEIRSSKELLNLKEIYVSELVQEFTKAQEDISASSDKVKFPESTLEHLRDSYDAAEAKKESLRAEIDQLEREYKALEDKLTLAISWSYLRTRF